MSPGVRIAPKLIAGALIGLVVGVSLLMTFNQSQGGEEAVGGQRETEQEAFDPWSDTVSGLEFEELGEGEGGQLSERDRREIRAVSERFTLFAYGYLGNDVAEYKAGVESLVWPRFWGSPYVPARLWERAEKIESGALVEDEETMIAANVRSMEIGYPDADSAEVNLTWLQRRLGGGAAVATAEIRVAKVDGEWRLEGSKAPVSSSVGFDLEEDPGQMQAPVPDGANSVEEIAIENAWEEKQTEITEASQAWLDGLKYPAYLVDSDIIDAGPMEAYGELTDKKVRESEDPPRVTTEVEYVWTEGSNAGRWRTEVEFVKQSGSWQVVEVGETEKLLQDLYSHR